MMWRIDGSPTARFLAARFAVSLEDAQLMRHWMDVPNSRALYLERRCEDARTITASLHAVGSNPHGRYGTDPYSHIYVDQAKGVEAALDEIMEWLYDPDRLARNLEKEL